MSDERFSFLYDFQVNDQRLQQASQRLDHFNMALERSRMALGAFEQTAARGAGGLEQRLRGASGGAVDLAAKLSIVSAALSTMSRVAVGAFQAFDRFGDTAIAAFGERSATIRGYTTLLGSRPQADLEFYRAQQFAQRTDFSSEQIEKGQSRLIAQGFRGDNLYATLFSAADLASVMPGDKNQTLERVIMAMSQIKAKGRLQGEELTQQLAEAGLNSGKVFEQLMKPLGVKTVGEVQKKISAGEVNADIALPAIQRAILSQLNISRAGEYATGASGSLTGLISNRDEGFKNLLKSFDADENLPGITRYKTALKEQGALFDLNTKSGKNLSLVLQDLANASVEAKSGWTEFSSSFLDTFSESYVRRLNKDGRDFNPEYTTGALKNLGEAIGRLGAVASMAVGATNGLLATLAQKSANLINLVGDFSENLQNNKIGAAKNLAEIIGYYTPQGAMVTAPADYLYKKALQYEMGIGETLQSGLYGDEKSDFQADAARRAVGGLRPTIARESKETQAARLADASAKKKGRDEAGWNSPISHYETGSTRGALVEAAAAINAMGSVESARQGSQRNEGQNIIVESITITVPTHPGQSASDIASAVHIELTTQLRQLSRSPRNR